MNEDGSPSECQLPFPTRPRAYFIFTFLRYYAYTGEREWLLRACDLADRNLAHSTPPKVIYANLPYSVFHDGQPGGSKDQDSIEPDKAAFLGNGYVAVYEAAAEKKHLEAAFGPGAPLNLGGTQSAEGGDGEVEGDQFDFLVFRFLTSAGFVFMRK